VDDLSIFIMLNPFRAGPGKPCALLSTYLADCVISTWICSQSLVLSTGYFESRLLFSRILNYQLKSYSHRQVWNESPWAIE